MLNELRNLFINVRITTKDKMEIVYVPNFQKSREEFLWKTRNMFMILDFYNCTVKLHLACAFWPITYTTIFMVSSCAWFYLMHHNAQKAVLQCPQIFLIRIIKILRTLQSKNWSILSQFNLRNRKFKSVSLK